MKEINWLVQSLRRYCKIINEDDVSVFLFPSLQTKITCVKQLNDVVPDLMTTGIKYKISYQKKM